MRYFILVLILIIGFVVITGCEQNREDNSDSSRELLADDEAPLLLEDNPVESSTWSVSDNTRCHVCHMNYVNEDIAVTHAGVNIGCAHCHGESDAHIDDESWASGGAGTPPDIMYLHEQINPFCMECHTEDKIDAAQHRDFLAGKDPMHKYCTDCHGDHRLTHRRVKWK